MTRKERVREALRHRRTDICPWDVRFTVPAARKLAEHFGREDFRREFGCHVELIGHAAPESWSEVAPGYWRDEFGVVWNRTVDRDIGDPDGQLLADKDLDRIEFPDPSDPARWARFPAFCREHADVFILGDFGFSLFERAWTLRGMEALLVDMVEAPAFVDDLLDRITEWDLAVIDEMCAFPIDGIHVGDDWGQQRGMIMGPVHWRRFLRPRLARIFARIRTHGKFASLHSCGDIRRVLPDLIEIGLDVFNPFQPEVMDVEAVKREFGRDLAFYGGISTQRTLPYGTPDDVRAEVRRRIEVIGADGGYICAPAHDVPGDVPLENLLALIEELRSQ